ncbi:MAG TPA: magnesium/cobalt transporter CorA [Candidatus Sulfomarinibacteraceae bacterium]|nr:magnesium/cobalt transporter CorA [Candidatus Sulfomarinibacteraceae bacterium]
MRIFTRRHAPGTAPGTLAWAEAPPAPIRMRYTEYDRDRLVEAEVERPSEVPQANLERTQWLDVEGHDVELIAALGDRLAIHPLALEDVVNVGQRTKSEDFPTAVFVVLECFFLDGAEGRVGKEQISLVIQPDVVLSVRERRSDLFEPVRGRLRGGKPRIRGGGTGYLAYALLDTVVDHLFPVLEHLGDRIEELEDEILLAPSSGSVNELHALRRELLVIRKSVWPLRDMLNGLQRDESELFGNETRLYLRDVVDHATRAMDIVETLREMVSSLMDLYLSSVSQRMNEVMKVLTIIATIFIPLSFIAGLYGMNFDPAASPWNMPELDWYWGYPAALAVMALVAVGLLLFFRRRGWL